MSVPVPAAAIVRYEPALSEAELTTLAGFLAAYRGDTRDADALDLRPFTAWCLQRGRHLFDVRRVDIEWFARDLEDAGKARATVARRLCTIIGFYRYAEEEGAIERQERTPHDRLARHRRNASDTRPRLFRHRRRHRRQSDHR